MTEEKPVVYILRGDDNLAVDRYLEAIFAKMGDPAMADLNTTRLDGRQASDEDLRTAAYSMPFLTDRRLVILTHPLDRISGRNAEDRFLNMLNHLPESTLLVLVVEDSIRWNRETHQEDWEKLKSKHWLMRWVESAGSRAFIKNCPLPSAAQMPRWIIDQARKLDGQFTPEGAQTLAGLVENDTQLALLEIEKLLTFVDRRRPVDEQDVIDLTASSATTSVFDMVDALAEGDARRAVRLLHALLEVEEPMMLFIMVVRQFRYILQAREMLDDGLPPQTAQRELGFVSKKAVSQAGRFSMSQLEAVYRRLLALDEAIKTGQVPAGLALDILVAELARAA